MAPCPAPCAPVPTPAWPPGPVPVPGVPGVGTAAGAAARTGGCGGVSTGGAGAGALFAQAGAVSAGRGRGGFGLRGGGGGKGSAACVGAAATGGVSVEVGVLGWLGSGGSGSSCFGSGGAASLASAEGAGAASGASPPPPPLPPEAPAAPGPSARSVTRTMGSSGSGATRQSPRIAASTARWSSSETRAERGCKPRARASLERSSESCGRVAKRGKSDTRHEPRSLPETHLPPDPCRLAPPRRAPFRRRPLSRSPIGERLAAAGARRPDGGESVMKVVITGGTGFIGQRLAQRLLQRNAIIGPGGQETAIDELVLFDVAAPQPPLPPDKRLRIVSGDIADAAAIRRLIDRETGTVFHLAAIVSGQAEADTDLGYRVNLDGTRAVLEACRALGTAPRVV